MNQGKEETAESPVPDSDALFREAFENAPIGVGILSPMGDWIKANNRLLRLLGRSAAELPGTPLVTTIHPDDAPRDLALIAQMMAGEADAFSFEQRLAPKSGSSVHVLMNLAPVRNRDGRVTVLIAQVVDITERKRAEEEARQAREHLRAANVALEQRNRELQDFAYVASHDLQEPLRKIRAFGDRLRECYAGQLPEQGLDYLRRMRDAAGRMQVLIQDLLAFSRITTQAHPFERVDIEAVAHEVVADLESPLEETGGRIEIESLPTIVADPTQMRQLLQNLLGNALKYHRPKVPPHVRIRSSASEIPGRHGRQRPACLIEIEDNGIGFDEKYLDRIFTVFQRLHGRDRYEGTGVGLAICRKIVERHRGSITARSRPGEGATFFVTLPLAQEPATDPSPGEQTRSLEPAD